ncbi:MAG: hypothetical protein JNK82_10740 [Myxococcaceae bacterium]|nr:hypothetical protein [Myxococcaceae bacterium]
MKLAKIPDFGLLFGSKATATKGLKATGRAEKPEKAEKATAGDKKAAKDAAQTVGSFAAELAQAQALAPQAPLGALQLPPASHGAHGSHSSHGKKTEKPGFAAAEVKAASTERPSLPELPAPTKETSAQPAAVFTLAEAPREAPAAKVEAAPTVWLPKEAAAAIDESARLTMFAHSVNFAAEGQAFHLQVRDGEVSIRARGELAHSLKASEAELRVALAQEGLKLRETESTQNHGNDDATSDRRRRDQEERQDEWT